MSLNSLKNNHYENIIIEIHNLGEKIRLNELSLIEKYKAIIEKSKDKIEGIYLNNYSQIIYLTTRKKRVIPIEPTKIPLIHKYRYYFQFLDLNEIEAGMEVSLLRGNDKNYYKVKEKPTSNKVVIYDNENKEYTMNYSMLCFEVGGRCLLKKPSLKKFTKDIELFKDYTKISKYITENGIIKNILMDNKTYVPIEPTKATDTENIIESVDFIDVENQFYHPKENVCEEYNNTLDYERYITKLSYYHMIYLIKTKVMQLYGKYKDTKSYNVNEKISFDLIQGFVFEGNTYRGTIVEIDEETNTFKIEVPLKEYIDKQINNKIVIYEDKCEIVKETLNPLFNTLFTIMEENEYEENKYKRDVFLCFDVQKKYPCRYGRLQIRELSMYGDVLKDKIISLFIETLVINGVNSLDSLVKENITVKDLLNPRYTDEIIYSKRYPNNEKFVKKSSFVNL